MSRYKWLIPIILALITLVAGLLGVKSGAGIGFDQFMQAIQTQGFSTVIAVALLLLLTYVIFEAVAHFNTRLDQSSVELSAGFREMAEMVRELRGAVQHLDSTLDRLTEQSAGNHEALTNLLLFQAHTQSELVAHRAVVEPTDAAIPTPSPPTLGVLKPVNGEGQA
jgi:hypothetical protein